MSDGSRLVSGSGAAAALVMGSSHATAAEQVNAPAPRAHPGGNGRRRAVRVARSSRTRRAARLVPGAPGHLRANGSAAPSPANSESELRDWIKENATLMSNASLLISISALALNLLPTSGLLNPYIQALIVGAALLLLIELHHQWPEDLQIHMLRSTAFTRNHSWRMTAFAMLLQIATVLFALWVTLNSPIILLPLTAFAVIIIFRNWYFRRVHSIAARLLGIVALIAVLLVCELVMLGIWAAIADEQITIEIGTGEPPHLDWSR
jgi:hypothetical protein